MSFVDNPIREYIHLANQLARGQLTEADLSSLTISLPILNKNLLDQIAQQAEAMSTTQPRYGWALVQTAHRAAIAQPSGLFLQSLSAWYVARASNHWAQPKRVRDAITLARRGFEELQEVGWLAACDWQVNALAWTRPNFAEATRGLEEALIHLEQAGFTDFIPDCRLAFAYAQILIGDHIAALENIRTCEEVFGTRSDAVNQARCWLYRASSLRRQDHFEEAFRALEQALSIFEKENALTEQAKTHYQFGLGNLLKADRLPQAIHHFEQAIALSEATDLELWRAVSVNNLGSVYLINGQLKRAQECYEGAGLCFAREEIQGALADNLNDRGKLNILMGHPARSIELFQRAEAINLALGSRLSTAIVISNLGEAYGQLGRYQDALYHLERAADRLKGLDAYFRLATCEKYMAFIWLRLGQPAVAHEYLERSAAHYEQADQKALLASVHNYRAAAFFEQGGEAEAIQALERSLAIAEEFGIRPQAALAKRLLGEALIHSARSGEALSHLEEARSEFAAMGMVMEWAACLLALGSFYQSIAEPEKAASAYAEALQLSEETLPEIDWRAQVELGNLAEAHGESEEVIRLYRSGMRAFRQIRQNFFQPSLAGSYLQSPARTFDRIVMVTAKAKDAAQAVQFIEETKASTLIQNLSGHAMAGDSSSAELDDLRVEIEGLKSELRATLEEMPALLSVAQSREKREALKKKIEQYDAWKAQQERKSLSTRSGAVPSSFDLEFFREQACAALGEGWVALDYYITPTELVTVSITPHTCEVLLQSIGNRFHMALTACERARRSAEPPPGRDLEYLGKLLLPASHLDIEPDAHLLIAPHRGLHPVPWAALRFSDQPLVNLCIPSVTPSLHSLSLLWQRNDTVKSADRAKGLLVGLSSFDGLHDALPSVREEIAGLAMKLSHEGKVLSEEEATWQNLLSLRENGAGLSRFAWLHIASHFSPDAHTGRVGGIALHGGDIWLDQLRDLAPLPAVVSLSACNSNDSFQYEGDERLDLQTTCLLAGANSVIGSAWPVLDVMTGKLMTAFYDNHLSGLSPAKASAFAQRQFTREQPDGKHWAGFICAGMP